MHSKYQEMGQHFVRKPLFQGNTMSTTHTKIWLLLVATTALFFAGCATETAQQRNERINRTLQAFQIQAQHMVEMKSGKPRKDWGQAETAEYNALFLQALQYWREAEQESVARRQDQAAMIANGFHAAGESIRQSTQTPISQPQVNIPQMQGPITFIPDSPGSQWGTIWGPNGAQRVQKTSDGGVTVWP
jgi:hypothetical protein